jgi:hypothetical protein
MTRAAWFLVLAMFLVGCGSLTKPSVTYVITTDDSVSVQQLYQTARVLGKYREMNEAEVKAVETELMRLFDRVVVVEQRRLQKEEDQRAKKERRKPLVVTRAQAKASVLDRLGKDLALPVLAGENRSVVAFGRVDGESVEVSRTAYEVSPLRPEVKTGDKVELPDGKSTATLIGQP